MAMPSKCQDSVRRTLPSILTRPSAEGNAKLSFSPDYAVPVPTLWLFLDSRPREPVLSIMRRPKARRPAERLRHQRQDRRQGLEAGSPQARLVSRSSVREDWLGARAGSGEPRRTGSTKGPARLAGPTVLL